jgi:L-aspartate oxidase
MTRRHVFQGDIQSLPSAHYDVIIVGGGLAGLYTALLLKEKYSCALLLKNGLKECNSSLAQGGVAAVTDWDEDGIAFHLEDTLKAGAGIADEDMARFMIKRGPEEISHLASLGLEFDQDSRGRWRVTKEGGHTRSRVLHCGGDATGEVMINTLTDLLRNRKNVDVLSSHFLTDILTDKQGCVNGIIALGDSFHLLTASCVVICTGGAGQVYKHTTNSQGSTGDGIAAALRAGASLKHMEFVQFHPTAFYKRETGQSFFLISEAVRGEGGVLRNQKGEAFMSDRHPMKDLAPRDVLAREIFREMKAMGEPHVYLDISHKSAAFLAERFPTIYKRCKSNGIDMAKDWIPVTPVQHYIMGGIQTDRHGRTSIPGLFACGEAACTGVHGANRLASNSLLECLVFARQCAEHINHQAAPHTLLHPSITISSLKEKQIDSKALAGEIKEIMQDCGGIIRHAKGMTAAFMRIREILVVMESAPMNHAREVEVYNMALVAGEIMSAAIRRKESVGAHYVE